MKKVKVLQFTVAKTKGGRTLYVLNNWRYINKEKFQFDFITFNEELDFEQDLLKEGCQVWHLSCYPEDDREQFIKEFDDILDQGYDIIHIHTSYWKDTIVEERAKIKGIKKIIIHAHNMGAGATLTKSEDDLIKRRHYEIRDSITENLGTDYWTCSSEAAQWLYGDKIPCSRIKRMNTAIDVEGFAYKPIVRNEFRKEWGLESKFVLGGVGRFAYQKNHSFMINVFFEIKKKIPEAALLLRGEGELKEKLEAQIRDLSLQDDVKFVGRIDQVGKVLSAMDIFLMPSLFEGFPAALVEAQASGLPCIVSDLVSNETEITPLVCYEPLVINEWVKTIEAIYRKHENRISRHKEVREAGYEIRDQIKRIEEAYLEGIIEVDE